MIILSKFEWISHFLAWNLDFPPNYWVGKWDLRGIFPHEAKPSVEISPESPIFQRNNGGKSRLKAGIGKELKFWQNNQGDCFFWFLPYFRNPVPKTISKPFSVLIILNKQKLGHPSCGSSLMRHMELQIWKEGQKDRRTDIHESWNNKFLEISFYIASIYLRLEVSKYTWLRTFVLIS